MFEKVHVSLQAKSKSGRYHTEPVIRERLTQLDGKLFEKQGTYYLRTRRRAQNGNFEKIIIIFEVDGDAAHVITQTSDHYSWEKFQHLQDPEFASTED